MESTLLFLLSLIAWARFLLRNLRLLISDSPNLIVKRVSRTNDSQYMNDISGIVRIGERASRLLALFCRSG